MFSKVVKSEWVGGVGTVSTLLEVPSVDVMLEVELEGNCLLGG